MKADWTINSHYISHTFVIEWLGEFVLWANGSERVKNSSFCKIISVCWFAVVHFQWTNQLYWGVWVAQSNVLFIWFLVSHTLWPFMTSNVLYILPHPCAVRVAVWSLNFSLLQLDRIHLALCPLVLCLSCIHVHVHLATWCWCFIWSNWEVECVCVWLSFCIHSKNDLSPQVLIYALDNFLLFINTSIAFAMCIYTALSWLLLLYPPVAFHLAIHVQFFLQSLKQLFANNIIVQRSDMVISESTDSSVSCTYCIDFKLTNVI